MKKDIFADWLREFCMLVFIQTVQAFVFAIVMSLILSLIGGNFGDEQDALGSTGIIAVLLLASVSKMEDIVKKIFGIKSGFHDSGMKGGLKSLATTMMAANMAKGVLDNGRKAIGGAMGFAGAGLEARKARKIADTRMARDINKFEKAGGTVSGDRTTVTSPTTAEGSSGGSGGSGSGGGGGGSSASDKMQEKLDAYNDRMNEITQTRRGKQLAAANNFISGISESAGALGGAVVGAVGGMATGDASTTINAGMAGAGIGDSLGKMASSPVRMANTVTNWSIENQKINDDLKKEVSAINETSKKINTVHKARKELKRQLENLDAGDL